MALPCYVHMEDQGLVRPDDGISAWRKTEVQLMVRGCVVRANLLTDGYSGSQTLRVVRDDIGLDTTVAKSLMREAYDISNEMMLDYSCVIAEAFFDLEQLIDRVFYASQAKDVIRRIKAA